MPARLSFPAIQPEITAAIQAIEGDRSELFPLRREGAFLYLGNTGLYLTHCVLSERQQKRAGLEVGIEAYYPGSYENPPESYILRADTFDSLYSAIEWLLVEHRRMLTQEYFVDRDEAEMARQLEEEERLARRLEEEEKQTRTLEVTR